MDFRGKGPKIIWIRTMDGENNLSKTEQNCLVLVFGGFLAFAFAATMKLTFLFGDKTGYG